MDVYDELYDSDTVLSNIVYDTFSVSVNTTAEDRPRRSDGDSEDDVLAPERLSDYSGKDTYLSSCQEDTDDSAIELVSITVPRKPNTACNEASTGDVVNNSKITDYFPLHRFATTTEYPAFLKQYNPTTLFRRPSRRKRPIGRPRSNCTSETNSKKVKGRRVGKETKTKRAGTYKSYSYAQKLKVVEYARLNTEAEASKRYGIPRSTIYYWKDIDKVPKEKLKKLAKKRKGST